MAARRVARCRASASAVAVLFLVETGAYINAIRMDILATALAHRHGMPKPEDVLFSGRLSCLAPDVSEGRVDKDFADEPRLVEMLALVHRNLRLMGDPFERPLTWSALIQRTGETVPKRRVSHRDGRDDLRGAASLATAGASIIAQAVLGRPHVSTLPL
jgi:hypothetical protein